MGCACLTDFDYFVCLRLSQAPRTVTYSTNATPLYSWRVYSDALKQVIRNLTLRADSDVVEVRKERCGLDRSRVTVVFETPDATPLYPWRVHSDVLKQVIRNLAVQEDSDVTEVRTERCGPNCSRETVVIEMPDEI